MTTATDHKNNLNRSTIKKNFARTLRVDGSAFLPSSSDGDWATWLPGQVKFLADEL